MKFTDFLRDTLRISLTPGQSALAKVAFDGAEPSDLTGEEREAARTLFGAIDHIPPGCRQTCVVICGRASGKTYLSSLRLLHLSLFGDLSRLAPGELAFGVLCAPDLKLARQALRFVAGAVREASELAGLVVSDSADALMLQRPDGRTVSIECLAASARGSSVRGRSLIGAVLDESCFFRDADYAVNDADIYTALVPRILTGGQVILASSPWAEGVGITAQLYAANYGSPATALAIHAPTATLRDDDRTREQIARERLRDPENARREFDAEFLPAGTDCWFDPRGIDQCVMPDMPLVLPPLRGGLCAAGADFAFRSDSSAIAVVRQMGRGVELAETLELRPSKSAPLVPSAVADQFVALARKHGARAIVADGWSHDAMAEHVRNRGMRLVEAPAGATGKIESYTIARTYLHERRIRMPKNERLIQQLRAVTFKPLAGGGVQISSPRTGSGHGDLASAFVLAVHQLAHGQRRSRAQQPWTIHT